MTYTFSSILKLLPFNLKSMRSNGLYVLLWRCIKTEMNLRMQCWSFTYWFWKPVGIYVSTNITYFTKQLLYVIYTALEPDKMVWIKCAKAQTNLRSTKRLRWFLAHTFLADLQFQALAQSSGALRAQCLPIIDHKQEETTKWWSSASVLSLTSESICAQNHESSESIRRKHLSWNAWPVWLLWEVWGL